MIGVDTNVLVRVLVNDDRSQARRALNRLRADRVWVSRTVLLETEWVLRHAYGLDRVAVDAAFQTLLGIASVQVESQGAVLEALAWYRQGMDFADALHVAISRDTTAFLSFDKALQKLGKRLGVTPTVAAP